MEAAEGDVRRSATAAAIIQAVHQELPGLEDAVAPLVHAILDFSDAITDANEEGGSPRRPMRGVVIEGPSGVGKTSLVRAGESGACCLRSPHS